VTNDGVSRCWAFITGEYPPQPGGVSDYTRQVAEALVAAGDEVHVFAPPCSQPDLSNQKVRVHRLSGRYSLPDLRALGQHLNRLPRRTGLVVQYVPQGFGCHGANLPLCGWLLARRRERLTVMVHEVAVDVGPHESLRLNLLGILQRIMAGLLLLAADRRFIAIPGWRNRLRPVNWVRAKLEWLPIPSNVATTVDQEQVRLVRNRYGIPADVPLLGHFGTFHQSAPLLESILPPMTEQISRCHWLLIGPRSQEFAADVMTRHPTAAGRLHATGRLSAVEVSQCLVACDVAVQPYTDGLSSRRGSTMASLALGVPVVSNRGHSTEEFWDSEGAVFIPADSGPEAFATAAIRILADTQLRAELSRRAADIYDRRFSLRHTVTRLRDGN
jgi:glycosyltransferase involved in cell wall biosynthesis